MRFYINRHPLVLERLHNIQEFTYPKKENLLAGNKSTPIAQTNRNNLLSAYPGVDGIKTGYLDESGYNIALTAQKDNRRLIVILLGEPSVQSRNQNGIKLLDYGFDNFVNIELKAPSSQLIRVWKGDPNTTTPLTSEKLIVTIPKGNELLLRGEISQLLYMTAPVAKGEIVGEIKIFMDDTVLYKENMYCADYIPRGSWWRICIDSIIVFFRNLFGYPT